VGGQLCCQGVEPSYPLSMWLCFRASLDALG